MTRTILLVLFILVIAGGLISASSAIILAINGGLHPGSPFFGIQYVFEGVLARLSFEPEQRAIISIELAERRIDDLSFELGTDSELQALAFLNADLDRAARETANLKNSPESQLTQLDKDLQKVIDGLLVIPEKYPKLYAAIKDKAATLTMLNANTVQQGGNFSSLSLIALPFPPEVNSTLGFINSINPNEVVHPFPLMGKHAVISCDGCHKDNNYAATPADCQQCHGAIRPAAHYEGACTNCHSPFAWNQVHFDHQLVQATDCLSCHLDRRPKNHFQVQCAFCHNQSTFKGATPDHVLAGATDCISCHRETQPAGHFDKQCSTCHQATTWADMSNFSHDKTDTTQCRNCHEKTLPAGHADVGETQCSNCHNQKSWKPLEHMDHAALAAPVNCVQCHASTKPDNHLDIQGAQCSACHSTTAWKPVQSMDHSVLAQPLDCVKCHAGTKPPGHVEINGAQCSQCHNTKVWKPLAQMDHAVLGSNADCQGCHSGQRPANHYAGQCSTCHTNPGVTWSGASFNHQGVSGCANCHE